MTMKSTTKTLDDGTVEILVSDSVSGLTEIGWVSSMHLTETKINQLKAVIKRKRVFMLQLASEE